MTKLKYKKILQNQSGKVLHWTLAIIASLWACFYLSIDALIKFNVNPVFLTMFRASLLVLSFFLIGYAIDSARKSKNKNAGDKDFAKRLKLHNQKMVEIIEENERTLEQILNSFRKKSLNISHDTQKCIDSAENLLRDLKFRYGRVSENILNGSNANLIVADSIIRIKSLSLSDLNQAAGFQSGQEVIEETKAKLKRLFDEILLEQNKSH